MSQMDHDIHLLPLDSFALMANNDNVRMIYHPTRKLIRAAVRRRGVVELALVLVDKKDLEEGEELTRKEGLNVRKAIVTNMWDVNGKAVEVSRSRIEEFVEGLK